MGTALWSIFSPFFVWRWKSVELPEAAEEPPVSLISGDEAVAAAAHPWRHRFAWEQGPQHT